MQYILIYIIHEYFFWNFILRETFFYTIYNRKGYSKLWGLHYTRKRHHILP